MTQTRGSRPGAPRPTASPVARGPARRTRHRAPQARRSAAPARPAAAGDERPKATPPASRPRPQDAEAVTSTSQASPAKPAPRGEAAPTAPPRPPVPAQGQPRRVQPASTDAHDDHRGAVHLQHLRRAAVAVAGVRRLRGVQGRPDRRAPTTIVAAGPARLDHRPQRHDPRLEHRAPHRDRRPDAVRQYVKTVDGVRTKVGVAGAAADLSPLLGIPVATLTKELTGNARYRILQKNITPLNWRKISAARHQRHLLRGDLRPGLPDLDRRLGPGRLRPVRRRPPVAGSRCCMDKSLKGKAGKTIFEQSQDGRPIPNARQETINPVPGRDVQLTIDSDLQWFAQNAVAQKVIETQALSGTVVVENVKTGELLAVASYPTFDPNQPGAVQRELDQQGLQRGLRARLHRQGDDGRRGDRGGGGHPVHRRRGPQPDPPRRQQGVQGQPRPPDRVPHLRRRPRAVQQHRHHPGRREGQGADDVRLLHASSASARPRGWASPARAPACSPTSRTGAGRSATPCCSARACRSTRSRRPGSSRPSPTTACACRRGSWPATGDGKGGFTPAAAARHR